MAEERDDAVSARTKSGVHWAIRPSGDLAVLSHPRVKWNIEAIQDGPEGMHSSTGLMADDGLVRFSDLRPGPARLRLSVTVTRLTGRRLRAWRSQELRFDLGNVAIPPDENPEPGLIPLPTGDVRKVLDEVPPNDSGYLVVLAGLKSQNPEHRGFHEVARRAARFHQAETFEWDGCHFGDLEQLLREGRPRFVLFVVPPELLDVNLHRRILLLAPGLDGDPFADFAFGYLTAKDGAALEALWARTEALHQHGLRSRIWQETAVTSQRKSFTVPGGIPEQAKATGFQGEHHYFAEIGSDPAVTEFARERLKKLEDASVICLTGNGDPQGIWLFNGQRNLDRSKHWPFDPAKVGQDPDGKMPRLTAAAFRTLRLQSPVIWSGTCHSGATSRVFVEGDIVSTFGRSETVPLYIMKPDESLALALLDAGAAALLVPIAANHGMSVSKEASFALSHGASLGEAVKSTWDDVFLQCGGSLKLSFEVPDKLPRRSGEHVMQGGGANRILIGDPALRPFKATPHPGETVRVQGTDVGFDVEVTLSGGFHAWDWDMFGTDRKNDWRIYARVQLDGLAPAEGHASFTATVEVFNENGQPCTHQLTHAVVEDWHGRRFLHLQANAPRAGLAYKARRAIFHVAPVRPRVPR
jgi:hypothetical protein